MFCNAAVCTSCFVPMEGQCAVNILRAIVVFSFVVQLLATAFESLGIVFTNFQYVRTT